MLRSLPVLSGPLRASSSLLRLGRCPDRRLYHRCPISRPFHVSRMRSGCSTARFKSATTSPQALRAVSRIGLRGCIASGCLRSSSSIGGPPKGPDDPIDRERSFQLNEEIKALGSINDKKGLKLLVRREQGEGGVKGLRLNHMNCSNWLNKWTKEKRGQHLKGKPPRELLGLLARTRYLLDTKPNTFEARQVCDLANALCKLNYDWWAGKKPPHVLVMEGLASWVGARDLKAFEPQGISNFLNAFARMGLWPGDAVVNMVVAECVGRGLEGFNPRDTALLLKAFATLGTHPGQQLCTLLVQRCVATRLAGFNAQDVADVVLSLGRLGVGVDHALLELVASEAEAMVRGMEDMKLHHLAHTLAGFALLRYDPGDALVARVVQRCREAGFAGFTGSCLSALLQALSVLRFPVTEDWMAAFHIRRREVTWNTFTHADLCGALAAVLRLRLPVDRSLLRANAARLQLLLASLTQGTQDERAMQDALRVCHVAREVMFLDEAKGVKELMQAVDKVWEVVESRAGEGLPASAEEGERVCAALRQRSYDVEERAWLAERLLMLDAIVVLPGGARVGVVVSGATDYFINQRDVPTGEALSRWRLLDRAKEVGLVQEWVWVRDASEGEIGKVEQAVKGMRVQ